MASDVVEFQRQTFLTCFEELKPKLPHSLAIEFERITKFIHDADQLKNNVRSNPHAFSSLLPLLNDLNDALADCTLLVERTQNVSEGFSTTCHHNPFLHSFSVRNMKQKLISKKDQLSQMFGISSSPSCSNALFPTARYTSFQSIAYSQFIGFDEQENKIRDLICESSYKAIGVYGMAGSGKTALILKLLNNPSVRNQFSPIIWLCLSDIRSKEDAEYEVNIVKYILCELGCDVDKWTVLNPTRPDLLKHLKNLLMSKKYLIVFDDVWENNEFYSNLGDALPGSDIFKNQLCEALPRDGGGKIIVTSRQREVGKNMVGEKNLISMKPLNRESCKMILEEEIGITGYAKKIEDLLNGSGIVSIGIYGPNSTANTALVRKVVFSTPSVREKFQPIIWVPVSRMSLNQSHQNSSFRNEVLNIGNEIVKYILTGIGCGDELTKDKSDFELMKIVNQSLRSKHYLIVLADVWLEGYGDATMEDLWNVVWERLSRAWPKDGDGVIIVTTELKEVVQCLVGDKNLVHVELPEWGTNEASEVAIDRHYISDDIVDQCCGLPFAAKTLGKIIREKGLQS